MKNKRINIVQWTNLNRNNSFVNPWQLPLLCEISGAIHLVQLGLTVARQEGRQIGRQMKSREILRFLKSTIYRSSYLTFHCISNGITTAAVPVDLSWVFRLKPIARLFL